MRAITEIVSALVSAHQAGSKVSLEGTRAAAAKKYGLSRAPKLVELIAAVPDAHRKDVVPQLRAKPVRTASGVAVVAVMSKPHRCPHIATTGNVCVYCPGGPDSDFEYSTQSYTGYEPTSMRAIRARYDPYVQARARVEQLSRLGHSTDKVEFILMGGTFMSLPAEYRDWFVRNLHDALSGHRSSSVGEASRYAERAETRCVGLTIETRPDFCQRPHLRQMLSYGCTRLEVGLQSIYEDVARDTNRGHTVAAVARCFALAKEAGFKVVAHMMPDLPNVGIERDLASFREFFEDPSWRADGLKLYPTLVIRGTGLYELWRAGRYRNYAPEVLVDLVARILALVPPWTRVYRVQRDIPMPLVTSGVEKGNLRELALARLRALGLRCRDVRTREAGIAAIHERARPDCVELVRRDYWANGGWETFLAYEDPDQDILIGLLRLRRLARRPKGGGPEAVAQGQQQQQQRAPAERKGGFGASGGSCGGAVPAGSAPQPPSPQLCGRVSMVRELHVYGAAVGVGGRDEEAQQHRGYGMLLMEEAERIAVQEHRSKRMAVISGIGTRNYYRKLGYELCPEGSGYMLKELPRGEDEWTSWAGG